MLFKLARASLLNRKLTVLLTLLSIAVSVGVLLGVEHIRQEARHSFSKTVSGVDLIVGARTSPVNLLLYSVFRIGNATRNIDWQTYQDIAQQPQVAWTVPISLGDSHRGFRVMGTSTDYFTHFRFGNKQPLQFQSGKAFDDLFDAVIGADVARKLHYRIGQKIVLAHGLRATHFSQHDDKPFVVAGILEPTGTPVDQTVHVSLEAIEAIHVDWQHGMRLPGHQISAEAARALTLQPKSITAFMVGLKSRMATFSVQRSINEYPQEALLAVLPGVALTELWQMLGMAEQALALVSVLVLVASLLGMTTLLLASMRERQREMAILRALGAHPAFLFLLIEMEALLITLLGFVLGALLLQAGLLASHRWISLEYGLFISPDLLNQSTLVLLAVVLGLAALLALLPAALAYRQSLQQGLTPRL